MFFCHTFFFFAHPHILFVPEDIYFYMAATNNTTRFGSRAHTLSKHTCSAHTRPTRTPLVMAAASTSLSYGFAVEGTPSFEGHAFENTAAWLRSCPEGAYTTARTVDKRTLVFEYDAHLKRLVETLSKMEETDVDPETTVYAPEKLEPAVRACFAAAVNAAPQSDAIFPSPRTRRAQRRPRNYSEEWPVRAALRPPCIPS